MGVDFDVAEFCRKLRPQDPPYACPVESCGKVYQSIVGLNYHLTKFDHSNPLEREPTPPELAPDPPPPAPPPQTNSMTPKTPANKISQPRPRSSLKSSESVKLSPTSSEISSVKKNASKTP